MKRKIFFAIATGFFAVATVFNMNMVQGNSAGDVSLEAIALMARAFTEDPNQLDGYKYSVEKRCCDSGRWYDQCHASNGRC
jgi:hypothetical protein